MSLPESRPRILCLGAGALHRRHFEVIRALGCHTIAIDRNPDAPSRDAANEFHVADPGDPDAVASLARSLRVSAILPLSEFGVVPAAVASARLGLRQISPDAAVRATDKAAMRQTWERHGIDQPRFAVVRSRTEAEDAAKRFGYPVIAKPRSLTASRGVRRIEDAGQLCAYFETMSYLSPAGIVLEQYIDGIETSVEGIVIDGSAIVLAYADKELRPHRDFRVTRSINYPAVFTAAQVSAIRACTAACVPALGLRDSPFHFEVFVTDDRVVPIECAARGGGGHIWGVIVKLVSGVELVAAAVRLLLGERPDIRAPLAPTGACYRFLFAPHGTLLAVERVQEVRAMPGVVDLVIAAQPGAVISEPDSGVARHGFLVTRGETRDAAYQAADRAEAALQWRML